MTALRGTPGFLLLEDGTLFRGSLIGAVAPTVAEVVFTTNMSGYQEVFTDPSYRGQIVVMTAPEIGNVGTNVIDFESVAPQVEGYVVRELSPATSSWRATQALHDHLREHRIPGVAEIDTRALTRHLRSRGVMKGVLSVEDARRSVRKDEAEYLELAGRIIEAGTLSERIRAALLPFQEAEDEVFTDAARRIYIELMDCLEANEPWARRWG